MVRACEVNGGPSWTLAILNNHNNFHQADNIPLLTFTHIKRVDKRQNQAKYLPLIKQTGDSELVKTRKC